MPTELAAIVVRGRWHLGGAYRSAADLGRDLDRLLARVDHVDHGAASTVHPEVRSATIVRRAVASSATQLVPVTAAEPPARRAAHAVRLPLARQRVD